MAPGMATDGNPTDFSEGGYRSRARFFCVCMCGAMICDGMTETLRLTVHYEDAGDGWTLATISEVPGAISQGRTREEARENVIDALRTVLTPDEQLADGAPSEDDEPLTLTVA